jgi:hypothetical protein
VSIVLVTLLQAAREAWNAARIVANPIIEATSPAFSARRSLQQLAQVAPLKSPELNDWLSKAGEFWQARAQQGQSLVKAQDFLKNFMQASSPEIPSLYKAKIVFLITLSPIIILTGPISKSRSIGNHRP